MEKLISVQLSTGKKLFKEGIMTLFRARNGEKVSLTRVLSFMVVVTILAVFVAWNINAMIKGESLVSLGVNEVYLLAIAMGAKVAQNIFGEKPSVTASGEDKSKVTPSRPAEPVVNGPG
jgi:hypothetical protein